MVGSIDRVDLQRIRTVDKIEDEPASRMDNSERVTVMDERTVAQKATRVLRSYLIRCHKSISTDYPEIANTPPENAADYLIHLRDTGRIAITLDTVEGTIICQVKNLHR